MTKKNANVVLIFQFLHKIVQVGAIHSSRLGNSGVFLYRIFIRIATAHDWHFLQCIPEKLSLWRLPATVLDILYPLKMTLLPGYWDADHDRPRTRNTRPSNTQCTDIFIGKSPTFSLRTSILLLASVILAPNRKYARYT